MPFDLRDLDAETRRLMLDEFESDAAAARVYVSRKVEPGTTEWYFDAQREAFANGDPNSLVHALATPGFFATKQSDGKRVNVSASAAALGDGQFLAYYIRAVCRRALAEGREVEVYRGQNTGQHRVESDAVIGTRPAAAGLLEHMRLASTTPWTLSLVGKVNSGLAVRLV